MPFGIINRFAGDNLKKLGNSLSKGYGAIDNQFGGILPGGAKPDVKSLVQSVAIEALPGSQPSPLDKQNKIVNKGVNATKDIAQGDVVGAGARSHGGTWASKVRERGAEYGGRKVIRGGAAAAAGTAGSVIAPPLAIYEGLNLGKDVYSDYLQTTTGKNLDQHMVTAGNKRDPLYGYPEIGTTIMPSDGSIPQITQGTTPNSLLQEAGARLNHARERFNPAKGDWGVTELLYGK
jgi:hypothetical protein